MLRTKLYRPPVTKEHVYRNHLIDLLDKNVHKPVTLVSAGAGYGKSMLISSWLEKRESSYSWISLNAADDDLITFLEYVECGIKLINPLALENFSKLVNSTELPSVNMIAEILINDLDNIEGEFIIVLDDYHHIRNPQINELLDIFLKFPPQNIHLVLITRRDPLLDFRNLRSGGRMNEIRMKELCFTSDEIGKLFKNLSNIDLNKKTIRSLYDKTEGWITGLLLTSLSIKDPNDSDRLLNNLTGNLHYISTYLIQEILAQVSDEVRFNLLQTSFLNRFCADLIDYIIDTPQQDKNSNRSGQEFIDWLLKSSLFIIPLDGKNEWFRYHHLFQDLLQKQLIIHESKEKINMFHLKASTWFDQNNYIEESVKYAISANKLKVAVDLVSKYRHELMNTAQMYRLDQLINQLPDYIIEETPAVLSAKAFIMDFRGNFSELHENMEKAKVLLNVDTSGSKKESLIRGEIMTLDAEEFLFKGDWKSAFKSSEKALQFLSPRASHIWSYALGAQVISHQMAGNMERAWNVESQYPVKSNLTKTRMELWYSIVFALEGDATKLKIPSMKLIDFGTKYHYSEAVIFGKYFFSVSCYLSNELEKAKLHLKEVINNPYNVRPNYLSQCSFMLASLYLENGEEDKAESLMKLMIKRTEEAEDFSVTRILQAMRVELALKENNVEQALLLNSGLLTYDLLPLLWLIYVPQLTPIKLKLAINTAESISEALQLLAKIEVHLRQSNKKTILIDVHILQAVALENQKKNEEALLKITEALSLSSVGNCIRTWIEFGSTLKDMLSMLLKTSEYTTHIRNILDAMHALKNKRDNKSIQQQDHRYITSTEMLSFRELEVIKLVAKGLRNKEIAITLFVAEGTIKKHVYNIARKLGSTSRIGSAKKAEEMGLI